MNFKKRVWQGLLLVAGINFSGAYAAGPHWTYEEQLDWGAIEEPGQPVPYLYPYAECGIGNKQSPVDISAPMATQGLNHINMIYRSAPLSVVNNGHTIMLPMPVASTNQLRVGVEKYPLLQLHFHAPSEHTLKGHAFPLEIHFVNAADNGKLAVVGVLVKEGAANAEFQKILDNAPLLEGTNTPPDMLVFPQRLLPADRTHFYNYAGSLTTPPCTEGVDWHVLSQPIEVSQAQITQFEALYNDNARHTQALNGRVVKKLRTH